MYKHQNSTLAFSKWHSSLCTLPNKMFSEITPAQSKFQQNLISVKNPSRNHQSHTFSMPHIASLSTHRCSKCFCCYCFRWNIQFEHCWLKFIFWSVGLLLCGPVLQSHLKVHKFFFLETKQISKISSAKINSTNSDAFHASDLLLRLTLHWMCITLLCSWFEAKYDLISKHFLGRHCVHGFFPKVTSHPILTQAKEGNLSLRKRRRVID